MTGRSPTFQPKFRPKLAVADLGMYLLVKCKSKEQYAAIQKELERRKEAVFPFGVAAGPDDLIWRLGTEKPVIPLKDQKPVEDGECYTPPNSLYPFIDSSLPGPEDRPGPSGSFYHYPSVSILSEFDQGDVSLEDEICVKEEPVDEDSGLIECTPSTSQQFSYGVGSSDNGLSANLPYVSEGGVSAHLLMSLDDGDEDPPYDERLTEVTAADIARSAMLEQQLNRQIKEEANGEYEELPPKARGLVTKLHPTGRTMTEKCVKEGCNDTVTYKSSSEWSMKCHHVFSHYPDMEYECPLCGHKNQMRLVVCRHLKVTHNQGFTPLYHPVCKNQADVSKMRAMILDCFPGTLVAALDVPEQSAYQPSVRAVMYYYVSFTKAKPPPEPKRKQRNRCTMCKACISRGPLESQLKCEHALTHSTIPWINCSHCSDKFSTREDFIMHAKQHGNIDPARPYCRRIDELTPFELEDLKALAEKLFPGAPSEPAPANVESRLIPLSAFDQKPDDNSIVAENPREVRTQSAKRGRKRKNAV